MLYAGWRAELLQHLSRYVLLLLFDLILHNEVCTQLSPNLANPNPNSFEAIPYLRRQWMKITAATASATSELLHVILLRLGSSRAAARTSVLSRRWRRVWSHLPELRLRFGSHRDPPPLPALLLDAVDGALAGYSVTASVENLDILFFTDGANVTASRTAPWLRFAAKHVVGEFDLRVPYQPMRSYLSSPEVDGQDEEELELPACTRAKTIKLKLQDPWRLRPQPAGTFTALISLTIRDCRMEASDLSAMGPVRLYLFIELDQVSDVSVLSDSLQLLMYFVRYTRQLEVIAPNLEELLIRDATKARISSRKLAELEWINGDAYDPRHHKFDNVGRQSVTSAPTRTPTPPELDNELELSASSSNIHVGSGPTRPVRSMLALISVTIHDCRMEASELTAMVSKRCPCLRNLFLFLYLVDVSDVSVLSDSLHVLTFFVVVWNGNAYDPRHHTFDNVSPHLRPLELPLRTSDPKLPRHLLGVLVGAGAPTRAALPAAASAELPRAQAQAHGA
ncbi:hypothetical protein HU200_034438 [Digitaria exilis]|uniref:F-box domain-containing protein n=1 Tax=Digitaria exilis TaxID=1010633 RepID=A0A835BJ38_9POAL|nr:hypothetical protein HU200_034438 [Digitaria exilis]